ncbi:hypothetical protein EDC01DRAFT_781547 [Geopyxis carbonaria]|nr:hypothetical protein EDC01DRAFT_781547 [Geopyxis carbonaria]
MADPVAVDPAQQAQPQSGPPHAPITLRVRATMNAFPGGARYALLDACQRRLSATTLPAVYTTVLTSWLPLAAGRSFTAEWDAHWAQYSSIPRRIKTVQVRAAMMAAFQLWVQDWEPWRLLFVEGMDEADVAEAGEVAWDVLTQAWYRAQEWHCKSATRRREVRRRRAEMKRAVTRTEQSENKALLARSREEEAAGMRLDGNQGGSHETGPKGSIDQHAEDLATVDRELQSTVTTGLIHGNPHLKDPATVHQTVQTVSDVTMFSTLKAVRHGNQPLSTEPAPTLEHVTSMHQGARERENAEERLDVREQPTNDVDKKPALQDLSDCLDDLRNAGVTLPADLSVRVIEIMRRCHEPLRDRVEVMEEARALVEKIRGVVFAAALEVIRVGTAPNAGQTAEGSQERPSTVTVTRIYPDPAMKERLTARRTAPATGVELVQNVKTEVARTAHAVPVPAGFERVPKMRDGIQHRSEHAQPRNVDNALVDSGTIVHPPHLIKAVRFDQNDTPGPTTAAAQTPPISPAAGDESKRALETVLHCLDELTELHVYVPATIWVRIDNALRKWNAPRVCVGGSGNSVVTLHEVDTLLADVEAAVWDAGVVRMARMREDHVSRFG